LDRGTTRLRIRCPLPKWWRRLGAAAFLFFLVKGLLWLVVPTLAASGLLGWF
jgi:hypothetical protein